MNIQPLNYLLLLLLLSFNATAIETDWLNIEAGVEDKLTGAKLQSIDPAPEADQQMVTIAIPKTTIKNQNDIEEIIIIGQQPKKMDIKIPFTYEWAKDFDNDYYGLIIKMSKETKYPIRIYFKDEISNDLSP